MLLTLKNRIIVILTVFTIVSTAIFISIQLSHELDILNKYNAYKAKIVSTVIKEKIEDILGLDILEEQKANFLEKTIENLKKSRSIEKIYLFDAQGNIMAASESWLKQSQAEYNDIIAIDKAAKNKLEEEIIVDKGLKQFSLYVPLEINGQIKVVARVFFSLGDIWDALSQIYREAIAIGILIVIINIFLGFFLSRLVIGPIKVFNKAAGAIAAGSLDLRVKIHTNDELEELAKTFNYMTEELVKMKAKAENANPLTKLPGNLVIMEEVEKLIKEDKKFTVIYADLDNFKAFNDKYGIHKGDEAIKLTGDIFKDAIKNKGSDFDFVGHEGGDDFIILTTPQRADEVTDCIIHNFDEKIRLLYDKEDLERGYIVAHSREGEVKQFPIMTISLAGVTNQYRPISTYSEVTNIVAEVKKKAKGKNKSCFVLDKREK